MNVTQVNPVNQNTPRYLLNQNALGSDFAAAQSLSVSWGLTPDLDKRILSVIPDEFALFKFYMQTAKSTTSGYEFNWLLGQYPNKPMIVKTTTAAVAASPGNYVQQTIPVEDICIDALATSLKIMYPDATAQGVTFAVVTTPGSASITLRSLRGVGLPGVTAGDVMPNHGSITADGVYGHDNMYNSDTLRYSNIIEPWYDAIRFDRMQLAVLKNQQMLDFVAQRNRELMYRVMAANEARFWLSQYGMGQVPPNAFFGNGTNYNTTTTRGVLAHMLADGVTTQTTSAAAAMDDVYTAATDNSLLANTKKFLLVGTAETLKKVGQLERSQRTRFENGALTIDESVTGYKYFGGIEIIPMANDAWKDVTYFGNVLRNDLIMIPTGNEEAGCKIRYVEGIPLMEVINVNNPNDGEAQFTKKIVRGQWGVQVNKAFTFKRFTVI
jgi:hypothetical protein